MLKSSSPLSVHRMLLDHKEIFCYGEVPSALTPEAKELIAKAVAKTRPARAPRLVHLCGMPGSGKTTYAEQFRLREPGFALVQFDHVMESLSGYRVDKLEKGPVHAFKNWESPARAVGYRLLQALLERRHDVLFDHSAASHNHLTLIDTARAWGYSVEMHYLSCSVQLCLERVREREAKIGRHTPPRLVVERQVLLDELLPCTRRKSINSCRSSKMRSP